MTKDEAIAFLRAKGLLDEDKDEFIIVFAGGDKQNVNMVDLLVEFANSDPLLKKTVLWIKQYDELCEALRQVKI